MIRIALSTDWITLTSRTSGYRLVKNLLTFTNPYSYGCNAFDIIESLSDNRDERSGGQQAHDGPFFLRGRDFLVRREE
jgi:hypothetical protein